MNIRNSLMEWIRVNQLTKEQIIDFAKTLTADEIKELSGELMDIWQAKEFGEEWANESKYVKN